MLMGVMVLKKEIDWGGRPLSLETGRYATQATGSVMVRYGDTVVLCTVVADRLQESSADFFPLTVNYVEKAYAAGKIPGGYIKREGRPSEKETLVSRLIDRPIRPLFHEHFKNETQVVCTVLSFDGKNDADIISIIGTSAALSLSGLPFMGPVAAAKVGYEHGKFLLNPTLGHVSNLDLIIAGTRDGVLMVESGANELSEDEMLRALKFGHASFQPVLDMIEDLSTKTTDKQWIFLSDSAENNDDELLVEIRTDFMGDIENAYTCQSKLQRNSALAEVYTKITQRFQESEREVKDTVLKEKFHDACEEFVRNKLLTTNRRMDGRSPTDIRPISVDVSVLPMVHGSAVFCRGETQVLAVTTLGTSQDEQSVDSLAGEHKERFALHYNFPPFSVGEIGRLGSPGRREIGHGRLAWRAVDAVVPSRDQFPYSVRVVSEVLSCNGSSSMATVCGASLALMDAGVPLKNSVAGIAMGLVMNETTSVILSDIMSEEDHLGDMDFKIAGTAEGITALQMDIKITGITFEIIEQAMNQARDGRLHILGEMEKVLKQHRKDLNESAPKMKTISIPKDKIREVIGSGGKVIREIIEVSGAKIDIDDDGHVTVSAQNSSSMNKALGMISEIALDPVNGTVYRGKIVKIMDFGAFVNFYGPRDGLVHVSEMSDQRVENVSDIFSEGDEVDVLFLGYDSRGRAKLTMKLDGKQE
ncbi:MAG: polyribonucleotide nucleotidyltransferase [Holosporaceae bacterium]|jgi:polyribonucleotide nucleotidyltransferase|nr:polyribonucleotide nucleotidyltransferase [Holosporaceae bacterium]